tara:strand:+ start:803 stop:1135 length:333 start_codon:yes stop_codon:yes gene_type:complete
MKGKLNHADMCCINELLDLICKAPRDLYTSCFMILLIRKTFKFRSNAYMRHISNEITTMYKTMLYMLAACDIVGQYMSHYKNHIPSTSAVYCQYIDNVEIYLCEIAEVKC